MPSLAQVPKPLKYSMKRASGKALGAASGQYVGLSGEAVQAIDNTHVQSDNCTEDNHHVIIGKEDYFVGGDGYLMPSRKDQAPPDVRYFKQGRLLMDEPLSKYFPKFADMQVAVLDAGKESIIEKVPAARKVTIQDLFRHTSGLSYGNSGATVLHKMYPVSSGTAS
jgi:hypothetical protein